MTDVRKHRQATLRRRTRRTGEGRMPGDPSPPAQIEAMIRVDHAGEYGAVRSYKGQLAVLGAARLTQNARERELSERRARSAAERGDREPAS